MAVKLPGGVVKPSMWGDILHTLFQFILGTALLKLEIISKWKLKLSLSFYKLHLEADTNTKIIRHQKN